MKFTIFTPTYNRAHTLKRLYESLKRQTFKDFEWLIVDDGSTDNTEELIKSFITEKPFFEIVYKKTENGGKHRAINKGVSIACGEMFFIADSDDYLTDDALEKVDKVEKSIPQNKKNEFAGVCGGKGFNDNKIVGTTFSQDGYLDITTLERSKYNISGDKAEVFYTDVLKKYPFPEFEGEKFLTECIVWDRIAHDGYKLRFFNDTIYICEYRDDGLTHGGYLLYAKNPKQWGYSIKQAYDFNGVNRSNLFEIYRFWCYEHFLHDWDYIVKCLGVSKSIIKKAIKTNRVKDFIRKLLFRKTIYGQIKSEIKSVEK